MSALFATSLGGVLPGGGVLASGNPLEHVLDHWIVGGVLSKHMVMLFIAAGLCLTIFPYVASRIRADGTGGRLGGFFEVILIFIRDDVVRPFLGEEGDRYLWIIWTFFFFILFCNLLGMIPFSATATGNVAVTFGLSLVSFCMYHGHGIARHGPIKYLKAAFLVGPPPLWPLMIVVEFFGHVVKPAALTIRLAANMVAGHMLLAVILGFALAGWHMATVSTAAGVLLSFLEILVAFIQAFIFTFLTTVFLGMSLHPEH